MPPASKSGPSRPRRHKWRSQAHRLLRNSTLGSCTVAGCGLYALMLGALVALEIHVMWLLVATLWYWGSVTLLLICVRRRLTKLRHITSEADRLRRVLTSTAQDVGRIKGKVDKLGFSVEKLELAADKLDCSVEKMKGAMTAQRLRARQNRMPRRHAPHRLR